MNSFGWKRKSNRNVSADSASAFKEPPVADISDDEEMMSGTTNIFLNLAKKRKAFLLEDNLSKSDSLVKEGVAYAEAERYEEAVRKWDEALCLTPRKSKVHEMKAQVLMELNQMFPAIQSAETAISIDPNWWTAHQTLARAQMGFGQVEMAQKSISRAIHLYPAEKELWDQDLKWIYSLCKEKKQRDCAESNSMSTGPG